MPCLSVYKRRKKDYKKKPPRIEEFPVKLERLLTTSPIRLYTSVPPMHGHSRYFIKIREERRIDVRVNM